MVGKLILDRMTIGLRNSPCQWTTLHADNSAMKKCAALMDLNKMRENQLTTRFVRKVGTVHYLTGSKRLLMVSILGNPCTYEKDHHIFTFLVCTYSEHDSKTNMAFSHWYLANWKTVSWNPLGRHTSRISISILTGLSSKGP